MQYRQVVDMKVKKCDVHVALWLCMASSDSKYERFMICQVGLNKTAGMKGLP